MTLSYSLLTEILQDPAVTSKLSDTKASGEVKALDDFYQMLQNDPNRAFYGLVPSFLDIKPSVSGHRFVEIGT